MNRTTVGSAAGAVLIGALLLRSPAPVPRSPAQTSRPAAESRAAEEARKAAKAKKEVAEDGPWKASKNYFGPARTDIEECSPASAGNDERNRLWCVPNETRVQAMIATVPDPVHTRLPLMFDRSIEAIQLAAQSMKYAPDRYWLPWNAHSEPEWDDYESHKKAEQEAATRGEQPGLLMFRWNGKPDDKVAKVLYVFLVAETATTGINGKQFRNAVSYVHTLCSAQDKCSEDTPIRIIGPTFSGSLGSLVRLTNALRPKSLSPQDPAFVAYSGTVSSSAAVENQGLSHPCPEGQPCTLRFQTFVHDTQTAINIFVNDLLDNGDLSGDRDNPCPKGPEVAVLTETNTTYGEALKGPDDSRPLEKCLTSFAFPREISSVRNAYNNVEGAKDSEKGNSAAQQPYLHLNLADQNPNTSDEPPDFSHQQGPLSKEATLMKVSTELHNQHYKYIGVIATNILDVLFLSNFVRKSYPDARLFVTNSDLLFERNLDNAAYIGTIALSTYPLVSRNLDWSSESANGQSSKPGNLQRLPFQDQYEQGQYNAALLNLQEMFQRSIPMDFSNPALRPYELPVFGGPDSIRGKKVSPPLWLSVVGTGGYWPVKILERDGLPQVSLSLQPQDFAAGWRSAIALISALAFCFLWALLTVSPASRQFRDFNVAFDMSGQKLFFVHLCSTCLALSLFMLAMPVWAFGDVAGVHGWHKLNSYVWDMKWVATGLALFLFIGSALVHFSSWRNQAWLAKRMQEDRLLPERNHFYRKIFLVWLLPGICWLAAIIAAVFWYKLFSSDSQNYGLFFGYRVVHFGSGVSPILPMFPVLAAMFLWSVFEILRLRLDVQLRPRLSSRPFFPGQSTELPVITAITRYLLDWKYVLAFFLIFMLWLPFLDPRHPFQLFDNCSFGFLFEVSLCIVMAMMLSCAFRLNLVWAKLKILLEELERSRLRMAFSRLKGFGWSPIWKQGGQQTDWIDINTSLEAVEGILASNAEFEGEPFTEYPPQVEALGEQIRDIKERREKLRMQIASLPQVDNPFSPVVQDLARYKGGINAGSAKLPGTFVESIYLIRQEFAAIQQAFANLLHDIAGILPDVWESSPLDPRDDLPEDGEEAATAEKKNLKAEELQLQRWENFAALRFVAFIRGALTYMRHAMIFLGIAFSLVLISLNLYSFEPHQTLLWSFTALFVVIGVVIVRVLLQVHRDHILSRTTDTKPNEAGLEFYLRLVSVGALPLLTLLATHFPSLGKGLLSLFQPGLEALK